MIFSTFSFVSFSYFSSIDCRLDHCEIIISHYLFSVRVNIFNLLTSFTTCAFEKDLQNDRCDLKRKILDEERWNKISEKQWQRRVENVKNNCENELKRDDDERFRWILIRNVEIRDAEIPEVKNINKRINAICLKWNVFVVYKQRVSLFEMCRLEIQKNQKFNRFFVNFRFFDSDKFNSNNLSTFRELDDSLTRDALSVDRREIFVCWEHNDQLFLEFRGWWDELRNDIDENDYLTTLFFYLRHHCLSIRICWKSHKMLHESVDDCDHKNDHESDCENDSESDRERANTWCEEHWFEWSWFWWCWFWKSWIDDDEWDLFLKSNWRNSVLKIDLRREMFISFYITEWRMNFENLSN